MLAFSPELIAWWIKQHVTLQMYNQSKVLTAERSSSTKNGNGVWGSDDFFAPFSQEFPFMEAEMALKP